MAIGANLHFNLLLGGTGLKGITTYTLYINFVVFGMNLLSHKLTFFLNLLQMQCPKGIGSLENTREYYSTVMAKVARTWRWFVGISRYVLVIGLMPMA